LGRGGSDLSATVIGAALNLAEVQVWKDVDGKQFIIRMLSEVCSTPATTAITYRSHMYRIVDAEVCWTKATAAAQSQHTIKHVACNTENTEKGLAGSVMISMHYTW